MFYTAIVDWTDKKILYPEEFERKEDADRRFATIKGHLEGWKQLGDSSMVDGNDYRLYLGEEPFHFPTPEEEQAAAAAQEAALAQQVRAERNRGLIATDYTELPNNQARFTAKEQAAWASYRQALRDVPQQDGFPTTINWPAKPGKKGRAA
jgi:hypothetical protein